MISIVHTKNQWYSRVLVISETQALEYRIYISPAAKSEKTLI